MGTAGSLLALHLMRSHKQPSSLQKDWVGETKTGLQWFFLSTARGQAGRLGEGRRPHSQSGAGDRGVRSLGEPEQSHL